MAGASWGPRTYVQRMSASPFGTTKIHAPCVLYCIVLHHFPFCRSDHGRIRKDSASFSRPIDGFHSETNEGKTTNEKRTTKAKAERVGRERVVGGIATTAPSACLRPRCPTGSGPRRHPRTAEPCRLPHLHHRHVEPSSQAPQPHPTVQPTTPRLHRRFQAVGASTRPQRPPLMGRAEACGEHGGWHPRHRQGRQHWGACG